MTLAAGDIFHAMTIIPPTAIFGRSPFLLIFSSVVVGSSVVASLAGFGSSLLALPLLVWICGDAQFAVIILLLLGTVQAALMVAANVRHVQWGPLGSLLSWSVLGIPVGVFLATRLPQQAMMIALGAIILAGGTVGLFTASGDLECRPLRLIDRVLLIVAGVMHGATGCGGPPVVLVARHVLPAKQSFRNTLFAFWVILNAFALLGLTRHFTASGLPLLTALGVPCVILGNYAGERLARRVTQHWFARIVAILLVITGLATIFRSITWT